MSSESASTQTKKPFNKTIKTYVIGSLNLHNELITYAIRKEFGSECTLINDIEELAPVKHENSSDMTLILIDSVEHSFEYVLKYLSTDIDDNLSEYLLALFNLRYGTGVEQKALGRKIKGFFYENDSLSLFLKGIRALRTGEIWISRDILLECAFNGFKQKINFIQKNTALTQREIEILRLVCMGAKNEEIADKVFISLNTVKTHLYNIYKKIKVKNRLQAALWAAKHL